MKKFAVKTVDEIEKNGRYYALLKISEGDNEALCLFACDGESVVEGLNTDIDRANEIFVKLAKGEASILHIGEIISDIKQEIFA